MLQVTHLFRDVLHGWGQILLAVCASPAARDYDETARVLRYASLATQIGTAARAQPPLRVLKCVPGPVLGVTWCCTHGALWRAARHAATGLLGWSPQGLVCAGIPSPLQPLI